MEGKNYKFFRLSAAGYLCYMKSIHHLVAEQWGLPFRHTILQLNTQVLNLMVVIGFILSMLWKVRKCKNEIRTYKNPDYTYRPTGSTSSGDATGTYATASRRWGTPSTTSSLRAPIASTNPTTRPSSPIMRPPSEAVWSKHLRRRTRI